MNPDPLLGAHARSENGDLSEPYSQKLGPNIALCYEGLYVSE